MTSLESSMRRAAEMSSLLMGLLCIVPALAQSQVDINAATMQNIYANLDARVSPCNNFWAYACGNWSFNYVDNFELAEETYANAMASVLRDKRLIQRATAPRLLNNMFDYFNACAEYEHDELELPQELTFNYFEWIRATARLRKYGLNGVFFEESADVAYNDSLRLVVQLKMPVIQATYMPILLFRPEIQQLERELRELCEKYRREEPLLESWTLSRLKQEIPQIDWQIYFEELLEVEPSDAELRVEVSDVAYLRALGELLRRCNKTSLELYLRAQFANFAGEVQPSWGRAPKDHSCVHHMRALLPLGMNYIYDRYVYRTRSLDTRQLQNIFGSLRSMFGKYLDWNRLKLSPRQLEYLHAKLAGMQLKLGNLPNATEDFYDRHYASARFSRADFQQNLWQALRLRTRLQHMALLQSGATLQLNHYYVNDDVFKARNAPYFEHERNTLTVPLIFLQWPFYDHRQHAIFQHSLMGFILGHELSHAFEQDGILFDVAGNESPLGLHIRQNSKFEAALQCVLQTPTASLKERLADLNGLQLAYDTFFGLGHDSQRFVHQPFAFEMDFPAPQLFHLNFAQFFCGRLPPAIGHDMDDVRVNEAEQNLHQFSIDFRCRQQSLLSSCEMWRPDGI
ncbi:phosphate-regulating neutral endopeptidase PHEX [Drosophila montana]|uniref:phosphate-regulating neutral endopeptidase PHEX n=1 Tax=Drosophila montana TaxID=40370 RepID=UPI00313EA67E